MTSIDRYGHRWELPDGYPSMSDPVRCRCGSVYDLGTVQPTARHADCTVWRTSCCGQVVDDREHKSLPDFTHLRRRGGAR